MKSALVCFVSNSGADFAAKTHAHCEQWTKKGILFTKRLAKYLRISLESIEPHSHLQIALALQLYKFIPQTHFESKHKKKSVCT